MHRKPRQWTAVILCLILTAACAVPAGAAAEDKIEPYVLDDSGFAVKVDAFRADLYWTTLYDIVIRDSSGAEVQGHENVATGQELIYVDSWSGSIVEKVPLVVMGDVLGTGEMSLGQVVRIADAAAGRDALEGIWLQAGDLNGSGEIDLGDVVQAADELRAVLEVGNADIYKTVIPLMYSHTTMLNSTIPLYHLPGVHDIPYISTRTMPWLFDILTTILAGEHGQMVTETEDGIMLMTRPNGCTAEFDFNNNEIRYEDFDRFFMLTYGSTRLDDVASSGRDDQGRPEFFNRVEGSFERRGVPVTVKLDDYGIKTIWRGNTGYIPLQTFSDLFACPLSANIIYNGAMAGVVVGYNLGELEEAYYVADPRPRSPELAAYSYNELCLALDMYYGLKEQHDISSFDALFRQTGLKEDLLSEDPIAADCALMTLVDAYIGDNHSLFLSTSFYAGRNAEIVPSAVSPSIDDHSEKTYLFYNERSRSYPHGIPAYEEVGDTAFVTIDRFSSHGDRAAYYNSPPEDGRRDTIGIITYAHSQITRPGSPIKNVVVDLSCCLGGTEDDAVYALAWLLGTASVSLDNSLTGAQASTMYQCDVNLDRRFDESDTIAHLNRYCLISPVSFSCANAVPAYLKGTDVTLIGQATAGGASTVLPLSAADGTLIAISGPHRMCTVSNGVYYEADRGVEPDYPITRVENFYNRPLLAAYLNVLFPENGLQQSGEEWIPEQQNDPENPFEDEAGQNGSPEEISDAVIPDDPESLGEGIVPDAGIRPGIPSPSSSTSEGTLLPFFD